MPIRQSTLRMHLAVITNGHKSCKYLRCANIHADAAAVRRHLEPPPRNWGWALRGREVSTARPRPALGQPRTAIIGMSGRVLLILTYFISYCIEGREILQSNIWIFMRDLLPSASSIWTYFIWHWCHNWGTSMSGHYAACRLFTCPCVLRSLHLQRNIASPSWISGFNVNFGAYFYSK